MVINKRNDVDPGTAMVAMVTMMVTTAMMMVMLTMMAMMSMPTKMLIPMAATTGDFQVKQHSGDV